MGLAVAQSAAAGDEYPTVLRGGKRVSLENSRILGGFVDLENLRFILLEGRIFLILDRRNPVGLGFNLGVVCI